MTITYGSLKTLGPTLRCELCLWQEAKPGQHLKLYGLKDIYKRAVGVKFKLAQLRGIDFVAPGLTASGQLVH